MPYGEKYILKEKMARILGIHSKQSGIYYIGVYIRYNQKIENPHSR